MPTIKVVIRCLHINISASSPHTVCIRGVGHRFLIYSHSLDYVAYISRHSTSAVGRYFVPRARGSAGMTHPCGSLFRVGEQKLQCQSTLTFSFHLYSLDPEWTYRRLIMYPYRSTQPPRFLSNIFAQSSRPGSSGLVHYSRHPSHANLSRFPCCLQTLQC
jgi:hypothetical protein